MRVRVIFALVAAFAAGAGCNQKPANPTPRLEAAVTCFIGEIDSRSKCTEQCFVLDPSQSATASLTCGQAGKLSEIKWSFVGRVGDKDVYEFTRTFPADGVNSITTKKRVEFVGQRVKIFEDDVHVIVIDSPK